MDIPKTDSYMPDMRQQTLKAMEKQHKVTHKTMKTIPQQMGMGTKGRTIIHKEGR